MFATFKLFCTMQFALSERLLKGCNQGQADAPFNVILPIMKFERVLQHHYIIIQKQNGVSKPVQLVSMPVFGQPAAASSTWVNLTPAAEVLLDVRDSEPQTQWTNYIDKPPHERCSTIAKQGVASMHQCCNTTSSTQVVRLSLAHCRHIKSV